jgi:hypothetical protein
MTTTTMPNIVVDVQAAVVHIVGDHMLTDFHKKKMEGKTLPS